MYVLPSRRQRGIARALLLHLEGTAAALDYTVLHPETGIRQRPAMTLYESFGFTRIAPFGEHVGDPTSICNEKRVASAGEPAVRALHPCHKHGRH